MHLDVPIPPVVSSTSVNTVCSIQLWRIKFTRPSFVQIEHLVKVLLQGSDVLKPNDTQTLCMLAITEIEHVQVDYPTSSVYTLGHLLSRSTPCQCWYSQILCGLSYIIIDNTIQKLLELGPNTLLAKIDIRNTIRLLPVHPADCHLLNMEWNKYIYINICLPFGLWSASKLFNTLADLLARIAEQQGVSLSLHYLDDFFTMGPASSTPCQENLAPRSMLRTRYSSCSREGWGTLNLPYVSWHSHWHISHGNKDTWRLVTMNPEWSIELAWKKATKKPNIGLLQHATKVVNQV